MTLQNKKVKTIMDDTKKQLEELGVKLPEKEKRKDMFAGLDEQAKEKAKSILEQEKSGKLTREQAKRRINKIRREVPRKG